MKLKDIREDNDITRRELAEYFSTSTDYILGLTDRKKPYPKKGGREKNKKKKSTV